MAEGGGREGGKGTPNPTIHQDLHWNFPHPCSRMGCIATTMPPTQITKIASIVGHQSPASAPSIFGASSFGKSVVIHSLSDFTLHYHRPAVNMNQHPLWCRKSEQSPMLCSSHIASSAYQHGPCGGVIPSTSSFGNAVELSHSKHLNGSKATYPQCLESFALPDQAILLQPILREIRKEPASRWFESSFASIPKSDERFAHQ